MSAPTPEVARQAPEAQAPSEARQGGPEAGQSAPANVAAAHAAQLDQIVQQILGGEIPGTGYLFPAPDDPDAPPRVRAPTPDEVRGELLRAIKAQAMMAQLPFGQERPPDVGKAALELAQTYLLLDPSVDSEGVGIEGRAEATAKAVQKFPPRVEPNAAEENLNAKTKPQQEALKHDRGQTPVPRPRVNS